MYFSTINQLKFRMFFHKSLYGMLKGVMIIRPNQYLHMAIKSKHYLIPWKKQIQISKVAKTVFHKKIRYKIILGKSQFIKCSILKIGF